MKDLKKVFIDYYLGLINEKEVNKYINNLDYQKKILLLKWADNNYLLPAVYPFFYNNEELELVSHDNPKGNHIKMSFHRYQKRRPLLFNMISYLKKSAKQNNTSILYLKGFTHEKYYPNKQPRFTGDIDIVINGLDDLWPLISDTFHQDYEHHYLPVLRRDTFENNGRLVGLFKCEKESLASKFGTIGYEFNLGGFQITDLSYIPAEVLFEDPEELIIDKQIKVKIPNQVNQILVLLGENVTREKLRIRDILDLLILLSKISEDDLDFLEFRMNSFGLKNELNRMFSFALDLEIDLSMMFNSYIVDWIHINSSPIHNKSEISRIYRGHIIPYLQGRFCPEPIILKETLHFYRRDRLGNKVDPSNPTCNYLKRLNRIGDRFTTPVDQMNKGHNILLVHLGSNYKGNWDIVSLEGYQFLLTPVGIYWMTKEALESPDVYDRVFELSKKLDVKTVG